LTKPPAAATTESAAQSKNSDGWNPTGLRQVAANCAKLRQIAVDFLNADHHPEQREDMSSPFKSGDMSPHSIGLTTIVRLSFMCREQTPWLHGLTESHVAGNQ
jgi:hypothetical protein